MLFSLRHRHALLAKQLKPSLPRDLRRSLVRTLQHHATRWENPWDGDAGYQEFPEAESLLLRQTGAGQIAYREDGKWVSGNLESVVVLGFPSDAMDLIEAFLAVLPDDRRAGAQSDLNSALANHRAEWRIANGQFVLVDSAYLEDEVLHPASELLHAAGFEGPLREFSDARTALTEGRCRDAVVAANNALESVLKALLGAKREKPGRLIRRFIDGGFMPEYYSGFLEALENLLCAVLNERNEPGRAHGSGEQLEEVPRHYAELTVHLVAALTVFMLRQRPEPHSAAPAEKKTNGAVVQHCWEDGRPVPSDEEAPDSDEEQEDLEGAPWEER